MFLNVLLNVALLLGLGLIGFILKKKNSLGEDPIKPFLTVLLYVCQPFMVANSLIKQVYSHELLLNIFVALLFCFGILIIMAIVGRIVIHDKDVEKERIYRFGAVFGNCGFFGLPLLTMIYGSQSPVILYATVFIIGFNILTWSLGIYIITGEKQYISLKKAFLTPAMAGVVCSLPFFFLNIDLPAPIMNIIGMLGNMTTPVSMIIMGIRLANIEIKSIFTVPKIYWAACCRLIIAPVIMFLLTKLIGLVYSFDTELLSTLILVSGMPTAVNTVAFAEKFGTLKQSEEGTKLLLCSTIACIVTIPLLTLLI